MKRILLVNAYESWMDAIKYAELLRDGICTLGYKKKFISSLHNAVELFMKQIMLDNCDYRIASYRQVGADGEPLKSFLSAKDLNKYFLELDPKVRIKFFTIEFSELIGICKDEKLLSIDNIGESLTLLNKLRNSEMHFYASNDDYLCDSDFCKLYNFMIEFYDELKNNNLLPWAFGEPCSWSNDSLLCFDKKKIENFTFSSAIKRSKVTKKISNLIYEKGTYYPYTNDAFELTNLIWDTVEKEMHSFELTVAYIESLLIVKAIRLKEHIQDIPEECGGGYIGGYELRIKTL